jgi:hypothetical protein
MKPKTTKPVEDAVKILAPDVKARPKVDAKYEVATTSEPLPQKRGACVLVFATAVRRNGAFTVDDIAAALPETKSAKYWTRRLARDGFFVAVQAK